MGQNSTVGLSEDKITFPSLFRASNGITSHILVSWKQSALYRHFKCTS